jgi:hypothetical protein
MGREDLAQERGSGVSGVWSVWGGVLGRVTVSQHYGENAQQFGAVLGAALAVRAPEEALLRYPAGIKGHSVRVARSATHLEAAVGGTMKEKPFQACP